MTLDVARLAVTLGVLALVALVSWRYERARARRKPVVPDRLFDEADLPFGGRNGLVLVAFNSRFCSECHETPGVVREAVGDDVPLVTLSLSERPELARKYDLHVTPTLFLVDRAHRIRFAHAGNPEPAMLREYVSEAMTSMALESWERA
ncbi:MAG: TlpA family protein disulfide reductase [Thermoplasmatota archaeon]